MEEIIKHTLKKGPEPSTDYIEFPDLDELLFMPMFFRCDIDKAYEKGSDLQRKLIDSVPLKGGYKYNTVFSQIQYLTPAFAPSIQRFGKDFFGPGETEWHTDVTGSPLNNSHDIHHLIMTDSSACTQFLEEDIEMDVIPSIDTAVYRNLINANSKKLGFKPKSIEANKFYSFSNHIHRAIYSKKPEFRFFFRISESEGLAPSETGMMVQSHVFSGAKAIPNIQQLNGKIVINGR